MPDPAFHAFPSSATGGYPAPGTEGVSTTTLPLQGLTLLAVEDSRYASDALRLFCQRSGARLRRAATLEQAQAHLRVYRPDVLLVDLGLPDGRGETLIRRMAAGPAPRPVLLGTSGDSQGRGSALASGADGFLDKPVAGLAAFQRAILAHLPKAASPPLIDEDDSSAAPPPDPLALHDDLAEAARAVEAQPDREARRYLAGFLSGLARQTSDTALSAATAALADPDAALDDLTHLLDERLSQDSAFRPATLP